MSSSQKPQTRTRMFAVPSGCDGHVPVRRDQILEAARAVIEEYGPDALTGQIAERAGLARPNFYRHFASKKDLDRALARSAYRELLGEVRERIDMSDTPLDALRAPIAAHVTWADSHPNLYRFLVSRGLFRLLGSPGPGRSSGQRLVGRHDFAVELVAAGARYVPRFAENPDAADAIVIGLTALTQASILVWLARRTETPNQLIDRLTAQNWLMVDHYLGEIGIHIDPAVPVSRPAQVGSKSMTADRLLAHAELEKVALKEITANF
jgi:AcrR family transcriptional regulator